MSDDAESPWYAVRCIFRAGWPPEFAQRAYEERITLWRARSLDDAIERAEVEAREYAAAITDGPSEYVGLAQAYQMYDEPVDGAELFSLFRVSELEPGEYLDRYFDTGDERQQQI